MKLRTFLLVVVGLTLVPLLGVAAIAIWWAHQDERRAMEQALLYHARSGRGGGPRGRKPPGLKGSRPRATSTANLQKFCEQARLAPEPTDAG
jgi:hypothetical protein